MRSPLSLLAGLLPGSGVNMLTILDGSIVVPLPDGTDPTDVEAIKQAMPHLTITATASGLCSTPTGGFISLLQAAIR